MEDALLELQLASWPITVKEGFDIRFKRDPQGFVPSIKNHRAHLKLCRFGLGDTGACGNLAGNKRDEPNSRFLVFHLCGSRSCSTMSNSPKAKERHSTFELWQTHVSLVEYR